VAVGVADVHTQISGDIRISTQTLEVDCQKHQPIDRTNERPVNYDACENYPIKCKSKMPINRPEGTPSPSAAPADRLVLDKCLLINYSLYKILVRRS